MRSDRGKLLRRFTDQMSRPRGATWIDGVLLIGTILVTLVIASYFLRNGTPSLGPASSVSNAPAP